MKVSKQKRAVPTATENIHYAHVVDCSAEQDRKAKMIVRAAFAADPGLWYNEPALMKLMDEVHDIATIHQSYFGSFRIFFGASIGCLTGDYELCCVAVTGAVWVNMRLTKGMTKL